MVRRRSTIAMWDEKLAGQPIGPRFHVGRGRAAAVEVHQRFGELVLRQDVGQLVRHAPDDLLPALVPAGTKADH
jgi:hypothetical protein